MAHKGVGGVEALRDVTVVCGSEPAERRERLRRAFVWTRGSLHSSRTCRRETCRGERQDSGTSSARKCNCHACGGSPRERTATSGAIAPSLAM